MSSRREYGLSRKRAILAERRAYVQMVIEGLARPATLKAGGQGLAVGSKTESGAFTLREGPEDLRVGKRHGILPPKRVRQAPSYADGKGRA
jgi:hypothetical protein